MGRKDDDSGTRAMPTLDNKPARQRRGSFWDRQEDPSGMSEPEADEPMRKGPSGSTMALPTLAQQEELLGNLQRRKKAGHLRLVADETEPSAQPQPVSQTTDNDDDSLSSLVNAIDPAEWQVAFHSAPTQAVQTPASSPTAADEAPSTLHEDATRAIALGDIHQAHTVALPTLTRDDGD